MLRLTFPTGTIIETDDAQAAAQLLEADRLSRVYTVAGLAERLEIGETTAYALIREGRIHYTCLGAKNYRTTERDVQELLAKPKALSRKAA